MKRLNFLLLLHLLRLCQTPHPPSPTKKRFILRANILYVYIIIFQQDKKHESSGPESSTPQNKKKGKKKPNRFKNHIKARALISRLSKGTSAQQNKERPSSPTLSYDSGSGDEEGPQLGIGVKTFEKVITDSVSVHWPIQCQVSYLF